MGTKGGVIFMKYFSKTSRFATKLLFLFSKMKTAVLRFSNNEKVILWQNETF